MTSKHLLILDLPGGNDTDILQAAIERGDSFSFLTSDLSLYEAQPQVWVWVKQARHLVEIENYNEAEIHMFMRALHQFEPFHALLCLIDIRLEVAARLAQALGLKFLNPESAKLLRDKFKVRELLQSKGIVQPAFALATSNEELKAAVEAIGLPALIKPCDGYGSQNIVVLQEPHDLDPWFSPLDTMLPLRTDYGLGVTANDRLLVEQHMQGTVVACDVFTRDGVHEMLGVNEKKFFDSPSFAIQGGCFMPMHQDLAFLQDYVFAMLDAVGFDWGATHVELMLTPEGPRLIEINARLVGAKIPRLMGLALDESIHSRLIDLHLGVAHHMPSTAQPKVAVTRWVVAHQQGIFNRVDLPQWQDTNLRCVEILKQPGDAVCVPMENADRIGYVMTTGEARAQAEHLAERFVADCVVNYQRLYLVERPDVQRMHAVVQTTPALEDEQPRVRYG